MSGNTLKIISGAQTGADRAALDVAIELGMDYGGAVPRGRKAEDGPVDRKYDRLTELDTGNYSVRTERNILDANATIVFTKGHPTGGTELTVYLAGEYKKLFLVIDISEHTEEESVELIKDWLQKSKPRTPNIAGPRESKCPGMYGAVFKILSAVLIHHAEKNSIQTKN